MPKRGKKYQDSVKEYDKTELYDVEDAMDIVVKTSKAKFDETVEAARQTGCRWKTCGPAGKRSHSSPSRCRKDQDSSCLCQRS